MAKIVVECSNPNDLEALEAAIEQAAGKCNVTYFKQHEALVDAGKSGSQRESARMIAAETGESPAAVEQRIRRGKHEVRQPVALPKVQPESFGKIMNEFGFNCENCTLPSVRPCMCLGILARTISEIEMSELVLRLYAAATKTTVDELMAGEA